MCIIVNSTFENVHIKKIIKHPSDWPNYLDEICKIYGFKEKLNPICFTPEGILIGCHVRFKAMLQKKFGTDKLDKTGLQNITKDLNKLIAQEDYDFRHRDKALQEKVDDAYSIHLLKGDFILPLEPWCFKKVGADTCWIKQSKFVSPQVFIQEEKKVDMSYLVRNDPEFDIAVAILVDKAQEEVVEPDADKKDGKGNKAGTDKKEDGKGGSHDGSQGMPTGKEGDDAVLAEDHDGTGADGVDIKLAHNKTDSGTGEVVLGEDGLPIEGAEKKEGDDNIDDCDVVQSEGGVEEEEDEIEVEDIDFSRVQELINQKTSDRKDLEDWVVDEIGNDYV